MSAFCKGCRKTKDNDEFGLKYDESQYKTCMKCRYKKKGVNVTFKSPECCDAEEIRNTFRKLNCEIVYFKELEYMLNLDTQIARHIFRGMFSHGNIAIVETITPYNIAPIVKFLQHIGFPTEDIRTYNLNIILYKDSNQTMNRAMDDVIITAMNASASTGVAGATSTALPSTQKFATSDQSDGLTIAKLIAAKKNFDNNSIDPSRKRYLVCGPKQVADLLAVTQVTSSDFNTVKALAQGDINSFLGFEFIMSNRLPLDATNTDDRLIFAYTEDAIKLAIGNKVDCKLLSTFFSANGILVFPAR